MTLAEILAETANPRSSARLNRERARWFVEMLRNVIAIARYDLRFYERYPEHACPALIARRVVRIAECEGAILILARVGEGPIVLDWTTPVPDRLPALIEREG